MSDPSDARSVNSVYLRLELKRYIGQEVVDGRTCKTNAKRPSGGNTSITSGKTFNSLLFFTAKTVASGVGAIAKPRRRRGAG